MHVLIRTLPLGYGNYGGIIQAWALQKALVNMGHTPVTDVSERPRSLPRSAIKQIALGARSTMPLAWRAIPGDAKRYRDHPLSDFVRDNIQTTTLFHSTSKTPRANVLTAVDAFITGSDQVWRSDFADVPSYMFDFLSRGDPRPRIAYAASMGSLRQNRWSNGEVAQIRELLGAFSAISTREDESAAWVRQEGRRDCEVMPDPTLLVDTEGYEQLFGRPFVSGVIPDQPYLLAYILDEGTEIDNAVQALARRLNLRVVSLETSPTEQRRTVYEWLGLIRGASFVATDSFHGTVFSALFNRPFATYTNKRRGLARFETLARALGLGAQMIDSQSALATAPVAEIDWATVNVKVTEMRLRGVDFLRRATLSIDEPR